MMGNFKEKVIDKHLNGEKQDRDSGIELLRIILMLYIIWGHCISQSALPEDMPNGSKILQICMGSFARIATSCYMVISAWFIPVNIEPQKLIQRGNRLLTQYIISCIMLSITFKKYASWHDLLYSLFPLIWNPLWYVTCYIMFLYALPIICTGLKNIENRILQSYSLIALIIFFATNTMYPLIYKGAFPDENLHEELLAFISTFIILQGFKKYIDHIQTVAMILGGVFLCSALCIVQFISINYGELKRISYIISNYSSQIGMLPSLITAICIVIPFSRCHFKSSLINTIARGTLCAYIFHQMPFLYPHLWDEIFHVNQMALLSTELYAMYLVFVGICVLAVGMFLEMVTSKLSKMIILYFKNV